MSEQKTDATANAANAEKPNVNEAASRASTSEKVDIFVTETVKHNGTFYSNTVLSVDKEIARALVRKGAAREATAEESDEYSAKKSEKSGMSDPNTARMLDLKNSPEMSERFKADIESMEPAVDEDGNPIPNSMMTDERKLRDDEGNTNTAKVRQGSDDSESSDKSAKTGGKKSPSL